MANSSTVGFGLRPIKNVGQTDDNAGLSEWSIAASSALISHQDMCQVTADGVILVSGATDENNVGSLNGAFYTDPTSNKPTWSNYWPNAVAATDAVAFINSNPFQMFEIMSADTSFNQNEVGGCADSVPAVGTTPLFISKTKISATTSSSQAQLKILGVSRDPDHSDTTVEGFALRVKINEHFITALGGV